MRKERDGASTKTVVLKAARQAFAARGFAGTSLAMISQACGISDGLILHHFKSKENLYRMVQEDLAAEYMAAILPPVAEHAGRATVRPGFAARGLRILGAGIARISAFHCGLIWRTKAPLSNRKPN